MKHALQLLPKLETAMVPTSEGTVRWQGCSFNPQAGKPHQQAPSKQHPHRDTWNHWQATGTWSLAIPTPDLHEQGLRPQPRSWRKTKSVSRCPGFPEPKAAGRWPLSHLHLHTCLRTCNWWNNAPWTRSSSKKRVWKVSSSPVSGGGRPTGEMWAWELSSAQQA